MKAPLAVAAVAISMLAGAPPCVAQASAEVTIKVPLNLTQFGADIPKVKITCLITSEAITNGTGPRQMMKEQEVPMTSGKVQETVSIVVSFTQLDNPAGKSALVNCELKGWDVAAQVWSSFGPNRSNPSFRSPTELSPSSTSAFVW